MSERFHMGQTMAECDCQSPSCEQAERCLATSRFCVARNGACEDGCKHGRMCPRFIEGVRNGEPFECA